MTGEPARNDVLSAIARRQSIRRFSDKPLAIESVFSLLEYAARAPSGFNLQPWRFIVVQDTNLRHHLWHVAMKQVQVLEAPITVVFIADPRSWGSHYDRVLQMSLDAGALDAGRAARYKKSVRLHLRMGPFGLFGFMKKLALPFMRLRRPTPNVATSQSDADHYVMSQTVVAASTFMLAATGVGLATSALEGFDELRLKNLLKIPHHMRVPVMVCIGYPKDQNPPPRTPRIPTEERISVDYYHRKPAPTAPKN